MLKQIVSYGCDSYRTLVWIHLVVEDLYVIILNNFSCYIFIGIRPTDLANAFPEYAQLFKRH